MNGVILTQKELNANQDLFKLVVILFGITILFTAIGLIARVMVFKKAGKDILHALIPFYAEYILNVEIAGLHWAYAVLEMFALVFSTTFPEVSLIGLLLVRVLRTYNLAIRFSGNVIKETILGAIAETVLFLIYGLSKKYEYHHYDVKESSFISELIINKKEKGAYKC